jgi:hypothetical protein
MAITPILPPLGGAAVSGETLLGDYKLSPRAGFDLAWSPGGKAEFEISRDAIEQMASLSTGEVLGLRVFGELQFNDLLPDDPQDLALTPMVFCDQPIAEQHSECGVGLSVALSNKDKKTGASYGIELDGERSRTRQTIRLQLNYRRPLFGGELLGTGAMQQNGEMAVGANYVLKF